MEYGFNHRSFLKRILIHSMPFTLSYLIAFIVVLMLSHNYIIAIALFSTFYLLTIASLIKWNIYFIQEICIKDKQMHLRVFKYDKNIIDTDFDLDKIHITKLTASSSLRGKSYKLQVELGDQKIEQYQIHGWTKEHFNSIMDAIQGVQ